MSAGVEAAVAGAFREEWGRIVAFLIRMTGDWDLAEECAQDAFAQALVRWPRRWRPAPPRRMADHDGAKPGPGPAASPRERGRQDAGGNGDHAPGRVG